MSNKLNETLDNYTLGKIKEFALKHIKHKNLQIDYYNSDEGKEIYRKNARKYYYNHREECCRKAREKYAKRMEKLGKPKRKPGRPRKNQKIISDNI